MGDERYWEADHLRRELRASLTAGQLARYFDWSLEAFGPGARTAAVIDHIEREILEVKKAPEDPEEWADIVILAIQGAMRHGASPQGILTTITTKMAKNMRRTWPDWRTQDPDKAIEHVRDPLEEMRTGLEAWGRSPGSNGPKLGRAA